MINILIADDNHDLLELIFKEIVRKNNKFRLTDYACDGEDTLNSILEYLPDVIILDLQMPKKDGISIINYISSIKEYYSPYIIVISSVQEYMNKIYNNKEVYAIIDKGNGFQKVSENINKHLEEIEQEINNRELYQRIKRELEKFNLNVSNKGTDYLIDAILFAYDKVNLNLTKDIFPILSKKYQVAPMNIKWDMEKNIKSMKRYTESGIIKEYFHISSKSNLTIKTVIKTIVNNIKTFN